MTGLSFIVAGGVIAFAVVIVKALRSAPPIDRPNFAEKELTYTAYDYNPKPIKKYHIKDSGKIVLRKVTGNCT